MAGLAEVATAALRPCAPSGRGGVARRSSGSRGSSGSCGRDELSETLAVRREATVEAGQQDRRVRRPPGASKNAAIAIELFAGQRQRLLHEDVLAGAERLRAPCRACDVVPRRDDDQVNARRPGPPGYSVVGVVGARTARRVDGVRTRAADDGREADIVGKACGCSAGACPWRSRRLQPAPRRSRRPCPAWPDRIGHVAEWPRPSAADSEEHDDRPRRFACARPHTPHAPRPAGTWHRPGVRPGPGPSATSRRYSAMLRFSVQRTYRSG